MTHGVGMMGKGNQLTMHMNKGELRDNGPGLQVPGKEIGGRWHEVTLALVTLDPSARLGLATWFDSLPEHEFVFISTVLLPLRG